MTVDLHPIRVLVIDDIYGHRLLCQLAVDNEPDMQLVGEATNGAAGAEAAERLQPDVVVLDVRMPVLDGFEALPLLRALAPEAKVLVWTNDDDPETRERMLELGASDLLPKGAGAEELVVAIREASAPARRARERVARVRPTYVRHRPAIRVRSTPPGAPTA